MFKAMTTVLVDNVQSSRDIITFAAFNNFVKFRFNSTMIVMTSQFFFEIVGQLQTSLIEKHHYLFSFAFNNL
jgi:hypothetical protein